MNFLNNVHSQNVKYFYFLGMVVSLTQPCYHLDLLVGAVGLDVHLADLVEDFTYFNHPGGRSYAFVMDSTGKFFVMDPIWQFYLFCLKNK